MTYTAPLIVLKPKTLAERRAELSKPLQILTSLKTTAVLGSVLATMLYPTAVLSVVKAVAKKPKTVLAVGTVGYLATKSPKTATFIKDIPKSYKKSVETTADIIEGKKTLTPESVKDIAKVAGIALGIGAVGVGAGIVASKVLKAKETPAIAGTSIGSNGVGVTGTPLGSGATSPILPETASITPKKRAYKRRTATKQPSVRQYVRVNIINKPVNTGIKVYSKKYINERILN